MITKLRIINLSLLISAIIIFFSFNINNISADESLVNDYGVTSNIPYGIEFFIDLSSAEEIEDIQVKFKIDGRKSLQYEYLEIPKDFNSGQISHFFPTTRPESYIPPGSLLSYYFEIYFEDGSKIQTENKDKIILDSRFEWEVISGNNVSVYFHGPVNRRAKNVLDACEEIVIEMSYLMDVKNTKMISLIMYNNYSEMFDVVVKKSETQANSLITEGQAFATENVVLVDGGSASPLGVATHEITHIIVARASKTSYIGVPLWLNEGLAEVANIEPSGSFDRYLEWAIDTGRIFPFSSLTRFPGNPNLTLVAYGQSKSFVQYLIDSYPERTMANLMANISERLSFNDSFQKAYGKPLDEIEDEWRKSLGITKIYGETDDDNQDDGKLEDNTQNIEDNASASVNNSSCNNGGYMGLDVSFVGILLFTYFVRKYKLYKFKRNN